MDKIIIHIDMNAFFARCEEILHPEYEGKPLIVAGTSRRGIVSTANYEARKYGIHSAMPTYIAKRLCPTIIISNSGFSNYSEMSNKFFDFLRPYFPLLEVASVDECYVDGTELLGSQRNIYDFLLDLQKELFLTTKLKCSMGVGKTKFLAKMGSDIDKPMGITIINDNNIERILDPQPIGKMYGIGAKTAPRLEEYGIHTIGDLRKSDDIKVKELLGSSYDYFKSCLSGTSDNEINMERWDPKSIGVQRTFLFDTNDIEEIQELLKSEAQEVSLRAKEEQKKGRTVQLVFKGTDYKSYSRRMSFEEPIDEAYQIYEYAQKILKKYYHMEEIRLIGITLENFGTEEEKEELNLFTAAKVMHSFQTHDLVKKLNESGLSKPLITLADLKKKVK